MMSFRVVPMSCNRALHLHPEVPYSRLFATKTGCWSRPLPRREGRWAGVCCSSSSFRPRAALDERSEFVGSFYELLGISETGSFDEIKQAYKRMALKYHPDASPPDLAEEHTRRFIEVHEAYEILSNPVTRALYDRDHDPRFNEKLKERTRWRDHWEDQLSELKRRSMNKDPEVNLSWAARMRRQKAKSSLE